MIQSDILSACYDTIYKNLSALSEESKKFYMNGKGTLEEPETGQPPLVCLGVSDVKQLFPDKNGEKIEDNEMLFEVPARIGCIFSLTVTSEYYPQVLETVGLLIQYFKDNNTVLAEDYKWHGETKGNIFLEPLTGKPEPKKAAQSGYPSITLEFGAEVGINSLKGTGFKRVEKRTVTGNIMN